MARLGMVAEPPIEPPRPLRPFLRFVRLPDHALAAARRSLEDDVIFRQRVAEGADEDELGRAGWLFVTRPAGWEDELGELAAEARAEAEAEAEAKQERQAVRRLARVEKLAQRTESVAAHARAEAARAAAELAEERRLRRAVERDLAASTDRATAIEEQAAAAWRAEAGAKLELRRWRARVAQLESELARAGSGPVFDPAPLRAALVEAGEALQGVRDAVDHADATMREGAPSAPATGAPGTAGPAAARPPGRSGRAGTPSPPRPPRRHPAPLPPAVFEDSAAAAAHLVRVRGVVVLVDGYNAAMAIWPGLDVAELRQRLVDALAELTARTGAEVHVVFDGAELDGAMARPGGRLPVRVTFSPPDVEADDVILELVDDLPPERPVVVATSDRRVQEGARSRGANVMSSAQLAGVLGR